MVKGLTKERLCTAYGHGQQHGDWLREGRGWDGVVIGKGRKCENGNRINSKHEFKK